MFPALAVSYYSNRKGLKAELGSDRLLGVPLETYIPSEKLSNQAGCPFAIWIGNKIHIVRERLDKYIDKQFRI